MPTSLRVFIVCSVATDPKLFLTALINRCSQKWTFCMISVTCKWSSIKNVVQKSSSHYWPWPEFAFSQGPPSLVQWKKIGVIMMVKYCKTSAAAQTQAIIQKTAKPQIQTHFQMWRLGVSGVCVKYKVMCIYCMWIMDLSKVQYYFMRDIFRFCK